MAIVLAALLNGGGFYAFRNTSSGPFVWRVNRITGSIAACVIREYTDPDKKTDIGAACSNLSESGTIRYLDRYSDPTR
jgi:hypothetical protein